MLVKLAARGDQYRKFYREMLKHPHNTSMKNLARFSDIDTGAITRAMNANPGVKPMDLIDKVPEYFNKANKDMLRIKKEVLNEIHPNKISKTKVGLLTAGALGAAGAAAIYHLRKRNQRNHNVS
jgi:hypothetical protein